MADTPTSGAPASVSTPSAAPAAAPSATPSAAPTPAPNQPSPGSAATDAGSSSASPENADNFENVSTTEFIANKLREGFGLNKDGSPKADTPAEVPGDDGEAAVPAAGEEEVQQPQGDEAGDAYDFNEVVFTGAKELNEQIGADPALKAALEQNPELKSRFFANARLAERANKYDEIVGSPDEAQVMSQGYQTFAQLGEHLMAVEEGNFQTLTPFIEAMKEQTALRDANGEIRRYPDGSMMTDGSVGRMLKTFFHERLEMLKQQEEKAGNDWRLAIFDEVMECAGLRGPSSAQQEDEPEELRAQRASLEQERKALDERKQTEFKADLAASDARVDSKTDTVLHSGLKSILDTATGLDKFSRTTLENNIGKELGAFIRGNVSYRNQRATIERGAIGPAREQALVRLNIRFVNEHLRKITTKEVEKAGFSLQSKFEQRQHRQAARVEASKSDTNSAMSHVAPGSHANDMASIPRIEADLKASLGREASTKEVLVERMMRMRQLQPAR